ncbi:putative alpha-glucosidase precursor [Microstroma glucosiphilum]|uniref:Putative alpha-glucosidase n=1 Tax=Pseudomicrostroma glucosiphilum TaxID=1684307 RepID=A0A316UES9_9BASI|nr:putative alpha-glucosidase precursor [Pseudomicrostroma glucosiphilum]PWN23732.1 putative alpha-glucosidase precursor [Pseudomicrostroma glucosiphilum]
MLSRQLQALALAAGLALAAPAPADQLLERRASHGIKPSFNTSACPGYQLVGEPRKEKGGFTATLSLAGEACNAYGVDIDNLTLAVVFEKPEQLHVHVYDSAREQYQLPSGVVFDRPGDDPATDGNSTAEESHLEFHHTGSKTPWAFWVTRKSNGDIIFDTRPENIPTFDTPMDLDGLSDGKHNSTKMPSHPMIFENQYLQLSSALPKDANIYGLGEYISGSFRRDNKATLQPFFTLDAGDPVDSNMYGYHPSWIEVRSEDNSSSINTHAVYYQNTAGMDVLLREGVIQTRAIGGTLDFRFFSGDADSSSQSDVTEDTVVSTRAENQTGKNSPMTAISQYVSFIGTPIMVPRWSLGFHLCRWGYSSANETLGIAKSMREHDIPLEVQWNDIDYMHQFRDWTTDPQNFSASDYKLLTDYLSKHHQHYIPIVDAAVGANPPNNTAHYYPAETGAQLDTFLKNANGTDYIGQVWPGNAYFPSWTADNTQDWWTESLRNFTQVVDLSGAWLDMSEPSSFCVGSCGSQGNIIADYSVPTTVYGWPEGYDNATFGDSGNITVDGHLTYTQGYTTVAKRSMEVEVPPSTTLVSRAAESHNSSDHFYSVPDWSYANASQRYLAVPPYAIHNAIYTTPFSLVDNLDQKTAAMDSLDNKNKFYDVHNLFGTLETKTTFNAFRELKPKERPFLVARSTHPGAGKYTHHWLGDNYSTWSYFWRSMQGILQFQIFGIPMVGPDTVGFNRNAGEELALRWQVASAMLAPFYRNHNTIKALAQEPFRWSSTTNATRIANYKRNELLAYYYSVMARASLDGTPAVRALWYEFPETYADTSDAQSQVLFGPSLLVSPVFEPNVSSVKAYFPEAGGKWRSVFSYEALDVPANTNVSISAPLGTINAHIRPGSVMLTHAEPKYSTQESADGPYGLLVNLNKNDDAEGDFYVDDGISMPPTPSRELSFKASKGVLKGDSSGDYDITQKLSTAIILGVGSRPQNVSFSGKTVDYKYEAGKQMLNVTGLSGDLNKGWTLKWA